MPKTIGAIFYLSMCSELLKNNLIAGYVISCLGDPGNFTYKLSRRGDFLTDRTAKIVLRDKEPHSIIPFNPRRSDERQAILLIWIQFVCWLSNEVNAWNIFVYHTSLDSVNFISFDALA